MLLTATDSLRSRMFQVDLGSENSPLPIKGTMPSAAVYSMSAPISQEFASSRRRRHAERMRDRDIRAALWKLLRDKHTDDQDTLVLDELGICQGETRADVAVVNGSLAAFEIKSDQDTLARLPRQIEAYQRVFDVVTVIVGGRYVERIISAVPNSWGIIQAVPVDESAELKMIREPEVNEAVDPYSLAQLLWRDEALALLEDHNMADGLRSKPRRILWRAIIDRLSPVELSEAVRAQLKARQGWRADPPPQPDGGRPPLCAS